ncbi:hypothetical protein ACFQHO_04085 [Actinomadura yumaensis]|uniref:hypothetical protein n=1 Tax=Actinomadura yumaensis TaxID=111807 RepID=UPI00360DD35A
MEDLFRFPTGLVEHADDAVGGDVAVAGLVVVGEREPQGGVDAFAFEDVEEVVEVAHLLVLVRDRSLRRLPGHAAEVARAAVGAGAVLGDGDGLAVGEGIAQAGTEGVGVLRGSVGVDADQVERVPVDGLPGAGGVGDLPAEVGARCRRGPGEEGVEAFGNGS